MTDPDDRTAILEAVEADFAALEQTASLIVELHARLLWLRDSSSDVELNVRLALAAGVWDQLDELGVDLRIDDLKTAVASRRATAAPSGGAPAPRGEPASQADTFGHAMPDTPPDPASPAEWLPGDRCAECGSRNTHLDEDGIAFCGDCRASDAEHAWEAAHA